VEGREKGWGEGGEGKVDGGACEGVKGMMGGCVEAIGVGGGRKE